MNSIRRTQTFPKTVRVRSRLEFAAVYEQGVRDSDGCMTLIALPNDRSLSRLGLAVSKRCGNSVQRNRLKRRLREAFRQSRAELPAGLDLVVQPRADTPVILESLRRSLISLSKRAAKKLSSASSARPADASPDDSTSRGA